MTRAWEFLGTGQDAVTEVQWELYVDIASPEPRRFRLEYREKGGNWRHKAVKFD